MKLKVLGSSSAGNCYLLENDTECLVIEAGVPLKDVKIALDFNVRKIVGVVVSHSHGDHAKYAAEYKKAGISVFQLYETSDENQIRKYGNFIITAFPLVHDVPCHGFYILHDDFGKLIYATDTEYIKWRFKNVNHILIEANHSTELVDRDSAKYEHQIRGHMNFVTTCEFVRVNKSPNLRNVVLIHLSSDSADEDTFLSEIKKVVDCDVYIAHKGLSISLDLLPF